jgi:RND family efflux transporter MFP subunit
MIRKLPLPVRHLVAPTALALTALPWMTGCGAHSREQDASAPVAAVRTTVIAPSTAPRLVEAVGSLQGTREAVLAAKVMGAVLEIRKHAGERVSQGEVLVVLDDREVMGNIGQAEGALAQAKAAAALAETNYKRFEELFKRKAASQLELDQARYQHETAQGAVRQGEAAVATASSYRSYAEIPAPFDGVVVDRLCEVGDLAAPGRPLMKVEDARRVRLHVSLAEADAGLAHRGDEVAVTVPSLGDTTLTGRVAEMVPAVDPATRTLLVKIDLPPHRSLRSGMFARASFHMGQREALLVPSAAVVERGGMTGVFVAHDGRATFRLVELGEGSGDQREVLSGLAVGEAVILAPPATLVEGAPVEVQP